MGKSTISTGPCSIAFCVFTREYVFFRPFRPPCLVLGWYDIIVFSDISQSLDGFHPNHIGSYWIMMEHIGSYWIILDHIGSYWIILDHIGSYWIILDHIGSYWIILDHIGSWWIILDHIGSYWIYWIMMDHIGSYWIMSFLWKNAPRCPTFVSGKSHMMPHSRRQVAGAPLSGWVGILLPSWGEFLNGPFHDSYTVYPLVN